MREVPKQNIDPVLVDVKTPKKNYARLAGVHTVQLATGVRVAKKRNRRLYAFGFAMFALCAIVLASVFVVGTRNLKEVAKEKGELIAGNILASARSIRELNPEEAERALRENQEELEKIEEFISGGGKEAVLGGLGEVFPKVRMGVGLLTRVSEFNFNLLKLVGMLEELQKAGVDYFLHNGTELVRLLRESKDLVQAVTAQAADLKNRTTELSEASNEFQNFNGHFTDSYIEYASELHGWEGALEGVIDFLDSKIDRRVLLMFHNASEMRPVGGFLGSYGELVVNEGQMKVLEVGDIYWPDHPENFTRKIIPPTPLQRVTRDWGARDANWFFDFPTSASTVMNFLESSKVYKEESKTFDAAIAVNTHVFQTILKFVGKIEVPEYELAITPQNFLAELQREVETGRDKKPGQNPKRILSVIAPSVLDRLGSLSGEEKKRLLEALGEHIKRKDIMFYSKDKTLASFLKSEGVDGSVYELPNGFWGSYLGVVNTNVAGGKTDAFIAQNISAKIDISNDGSSFVSVGVARAHLGENEKDPWYNTENKNFIQIFTNPNASLVEVKGNTERRRYEEHYEGADYETIPALRQIEETSIYLSDKFSWLMNAFGKKVVGTWFNIEAGEAGTLVARFQVPGEGNKDLQFAKPYVIIFERQSGVPTKVAIDVRAPLGFIWEESGSAVVRFESENPLAREVLQLHLVKS